jgi:hypothetical protein
MSGVNPVCSHTPSTATSQPRSPFAIPLPNPTEIGDICRRFAHRPASKYVGIGLISTIYRKRGFTADVAHSMARSVLLKYEAEHPLHNPLASEACAS